MPSLIGAALSFVARLGRRVWSAGRTVADASGGSEGRGPMTLKPGGIYSCKSGNGHFSVVKVLVVENGAVHVRLHKNRFKERPVTIDLKELEVAVGHVPLSETGFRNWEPVLLLEQP